VRCMGEAGAVFKDSGRRRVHTIDNLGIRDGRARGRYAAGPPFSRSNR